MIFWPHNQNRFPLFEHLSVYFELLILLVSKSTHYDIFQSEHLLFYESNKKFLNSKFKYFGRRYSTYSASKLLF